jgi:hypothetical protein
LKQASASKPSSDLLISVGGEVVLGGVLCMFRGMDLVAVREVGVVRGDFVIAIEVLLSGFVVVACSVLVMLRCLGVMMGCFV